MPKDDAWIGPVDEMAMGPATVVTPMPRPADAVTPAVLIVTAPAGAVVWARIPPAAPPVTRPLALMLMEPPLDRAAMPKPLSAVTPVAELLTIVAAVPPTEVTAPVAMLMSPPPLVKIPAPLVVVIVPVRVV